MSSFLPIRNPISRRSLLRGAGVALSLPMLEAMTRPFAFAAPRATGTAPKRQIFINAELSFHGPSFFPEGSGKDYKLSKYLESMADLRNDFTVLSGVYHPEQKGLNGHSSVVTFLTAAPNPGLPGFKNTVSIDQAIAARMSGETRLPCLILNASGGSSVSCTSNGVSLPAESSPSKLFRTLFIDGSPDEVKKQVRSLTQGRSILDTVNDQAKKLEKQLDAQDQAKLDQYFTSIRDLEKKMMKEIDWTKKPKPKLDVKPFTDINDRRNAIGRQVMMYDLMALALQTDSTRVYSLKLDNNGTLDLPGVSKDWHNLSHHGQDEEKLEELQIIEAAEIKAFGDFCRKLKGINEKGQTLLDGTSIMLGSNLGNASSHDWHNLPTMVVGGGYKHGQHIVLDMKNNTKMSNLFVNFAQRMGVEIDKFANSDSTGIPGLELG